MAQNQNQSATQSIKMDSRKFLGALNDSAQARVAYFEDKIANMGKHAGKNYRLTALHAKNLFFEDVDANAFYVADHIRDKGDKVVISNIRQVDIVEEQKASLFSDSCLKLVSAIEENDQKGMGTAFRRMSSQRFSSRAVPFSGVVKSKDNVTRKITVAGKDLGEDVRNRLIGTIVESLRDKVIVENGQVVAGQFVDGEPVKLPVTKWASRKLVARRMRDAAVNAYWSEGFQKRVNHAARLVADGKISEAVSSVIPFLNENEEFTLLRRDQVQTLIENALAAKAVFNDQLATDTATLFYRTNMRVSRQKILDEWRSIARKAEHAVLAENVQILEAANSFEPAYDKFLTLIFEAFSNKDVAASALATTLSTLRDKTPKIKESNELSTKLNGLISRLSGKECDDAAIYEAEDLIATIQEELAAADSLSNFDMIPGDDTAMADTSGQGQGQGQPQIIINSPLIQIGGKSGAQGSAEDDLDLDADDQGEDELSALLGANDQEPATPAPAQQPAAAPAVPAPAAPGAQAPVNPFESRGTRKSINEMMVDHDDLPIEVRQVLDDVSLPISIEDLLDWSYDNLSASVASDYQREIYEYLLARGMIAGRADVNEGRDPYAISNGELGIAEGTRSMADYGAPVINDSTDVRQIVRIMGKLAQQHNLEGQQLTDNLTNMAEAAIKAVGLRIPEGRMNVAVGQCLEMFESEMPDFIKAKMKDRQDDSDENVEDDDEDCDVAEDQFKGPRMRRRGYRRSSYGSKDLKESVQWDQSQDDGVLGRMSGVGFIFDHGGDASLNPVILSEDGSVEIPIPEEIVESAYASAGLLDGDGSQFEGWLRGSLEQLRPIGEDEDMALAEAMATIKTNPDGSLSVEVTDDVDVQDMGDIGDESMDMAPVDSISPIASDDSDGEDSMPDFESLGDDDSNEDSEDADVGADDTDEDGGLEDLGSDEEEEDADESEDDDDVFEDKDVTEPKNSKYSKHVKGDLRDMPKPKLPKDSDDSLEGIGPDLKQDDGTGTKPPTAKPMSKQ